MDRALLSELRLNHKYWPQIIQLFQNVIENSPSHQQKIVSPMKALTGIQSSPPISTFLRSMDSNHVTLTEMQRENGINIDILVLFRDNVPPVVSNSTKTQSGLICICKYKYNLGKFWEGNFVYKATISDKYICCV